MGLGWLGVGGAGFGRGWYGFGWVNQKSLSDLQFWLRGPFVLAGVKGMGWAILKSVCGKQGAKLKA